MEIQHQELRALYTFWRARAEGGIPRRSEIDTIELRPWISSLMLLDVLPELNFRYRVYGGELVRLFGVDRTGKFLADFPERPRKLLQSEYGGVVASGEPRAVARNRITVQAAAWTGAASQPVEKLILPLRRDGDAVEQLLIGVYTLPGALRPRA